MLEQILSIIAFLCMFGMGFILGHSVGWNRLYKIVKELFS